MDRKIQKPSAVTRKTRTFVEDEPFNLLTMQETKDINRLKIVLAEQKRTNKWLAEQLGKDQATISKWCTNSAQPGLETLIKIASCLDVDARTLIVQTK